MREKREARESGARRGRTTEKPPAAEWLKKRLSTFFFIIITFKIGLTAQRVGS